MSGPLRTERSRRPLVLLALGAALGLFAAAAGLLRGRSTDVALPANAVASINGELIDRDDYERLVKALASDRRDPLLPEDRRRVLERMIEEELLVQRGLELGLPRSDRRVRADLVSAVVASVAAEAEDERPSEAELRAFYEENRRFFARGSRLRVRQVFVAANAVAANAVAANSVAANGPDGGAESRSAEAARRLRAGEPFERVAAELGDPELVTLPEGPLPARKLGDYLGPTAQRAALELEPGATSDPIRSGSGWHVLQLLSREPEELPPLDEIRSEVEAELRRRAGERALRAYLEQLRSAADVREAPLE